MYIKFYYPPLVISPHLGDTRCQELGSSAFCPSALFHSQLVKEGEELCLKKGTPKNSQALGPIKTSPLLVPPQ